MSSLLVATDGSEAALDAARLASRIAAPRGQVVLLHVVSGLGGTALAAVDATGLLLGGPPGGLASEWMSRATQRGTESLALARRQVAYTTSPSIDIATELEVGRPATVILERLAHGAFDLGVVGGRGHGLIKHALLGSVAAEVLLHATKPVLIARRDVLRRILVATDGSDGSLRAASAAASVARATDASVSIVSAVEIPVDVPAPQVEMMKEAVREQTRAAFDGARTAGGISYKEERLIFGEPFQSILNEAIVEDADLIVVGRRRDSGGELGRIGSVAYRVAMRASCSVLVVP